jgi:ABC-2 type transport system permease protein
MQYRASFLMNALGHFLITAGEFFSLVALFARFGTLEGWTLAEVGLFYGLVSCAFALSEAVARGFDNFSATIRRGDFDRLLLRPRSTLLQIAGQELQLQRIGRFSQGLAVLIWSAATLDIPWTLPKIALVVGAILGGMCLFCGLFVLQATLCFWTVESLEVMNTLTYGGVETGQFPITAYRSWFRSFFIYVVPLACVTYFPALAILGRPDALGSSRWFQWLAPLVGVAFLMIAMQVWRIGVRHYRSTGS